MCKNICTLHCTNSVKSFNKIRLVVLWFECSEYSTINIINNIKKEVPNPDKRFSLLLSPVSEGGRRKRVKKILLINIVR